MINVLFFSGVKTFLRVFNNQPVIGVISKINSRKKAQSVHTFNLSTLCTNTNHDKIKFALWELVTFCFRRGSKNYIAVTKFGARWIDKKNYMNV